MKMRNEDLKKITVIKLYLLDPPTSFKLYDYALTYLQDAIGVLSAYPDAKSIVAYLEELIVQLNNKEIDQSGLRSTLKEAGIKISALTNK
jgi:hypothetical protein